MLPFNLILRVAECRLSSAVLAKKLGLEWGNIKKLKQVQESAKLSLQEMIQMVKTHLHEHPYSLEEIADFLGISVSYHHSSNERKKKLQSDIWDKFNKICLNCLNAHSTCIQRV